MQSPSTKPTLVFPARVDGIQFTKKGTLKIRLTVLREIEPNQMHHFSDLVDMVGWALLSPNKLQVGDVPSRDATNHLLSPSQRLRFAIADYHSASGEQMAFEDYYVARMDAIIKQVREQKGTI